MKATIKTLTPAQNALLEQKPLVPVIVKKLKKVNPSTIKNSMGRFNLYNIHKVSLDTLKKQMAEVSLEGLKTDFTDSPETYFMAMYNPDFEVFKHLYQFAKDNKIDVSALSAEDDMVFRSAGRQYYWDEGDTLLNIALILADEKRINFLVKEGYSQLNCTNYQISSDKYIKGNFITLAASIIEKSYNLNTLTLEHKIKYYLDFAMSNTDFDSEMELKPYSSSSAAGNLKKALHFLTMENLTDGQSLEGLLYLIHYKPFYQNENFVKFFLPNIISAIYSYETLDPLSSGYPYISSEVLTKTKEAQKFNKQFPPLKTILKNFKESPFYSDSKAVKGISRALIKVAQYLSDTGDADEIEDIKEFYNFAAEYETLAEKENLQIFIKEPGKLNQVKFKI